MDTNNIIEEVDSSDYGDIQKRKVYPVFVMYREKMMKLLLPLQQHFQRRKKDMIETMYMSLANIKR